MASATIHHAGNPPDPRCQPAQLVECDHLEYVVVRLRDGHVWTLEHTGTGEVQQLAGVSAEDEA